MSALTVAQAKSRLGVAARRGSAVQVNEARRALAAAKLEQYVSRVVAEAPPLTNDQADRIAALLRPSGNVA